MKLLIQTFLEYNMYYLGDTDIKMYKPCTHSNQGLAGFQRMQNNPAELLKSAYLQMFATKNVIFYNCVNIGSIWLSLKALRKQDSFR